MPIINGETKPNCLPFTDANAESLLENIEISKDLNDLMNHILSLKYAFGKGYLMPTNKKKLRIEKGESKPSVKQY